MKDSSSKYFFFFFVLFWGIEGCALKNASTETYNLPSDTPAPTHIQETMLPTQIPEETHSNTQETEPLIQPSGEVVYNSSYLQDCRAQFPTKNNRQVGLRNVFPGVTTVPDMIVQFGQSYKYTNYQGVNGYTYIDKETGYVYSFSAKNNIIEDILVDDPEILVPLKDILIKYGCPDLIGAESLDNGGPTLDAPIIFNGVSFTYFDAGLLIRFLEYPVELSSRPDVFAFMKPSYLKEETEIVNTKYSVLASFSEAVVQK